MRGLRILFLRVDYITRRVMPFVSLTTLKFINSPTLLLANFR